jgi:ATP-dependent helicase HrpA/adenine-specific DNA-methyltransferase
VLRDRRFAGIKFRRQHPIGRYILDFYCPALKLAIELDGKHHEASWMAGYEGERTEALKRMGIEVLRIPNELLRKNPQIVGDQIAWAIERRGPSPGLRPPSPR